jgi:AFG3 family protein
MQRIALVAGTLCAGVMSLKVKDMWDQQPKMATWDRFSRDLVESQIVDHVEVSRNRAYVFNATYRGSSELTPRESYYIAAGQDLEERLTKMQNEADIPENNHISVVEAQRTDWTGILTMFIPFIVTPLMFALAHKVKAGQMQRAAAQAMQSQSKTKFSDVAGLTHSKVEIQEFVDFLKHKDKFASIGATIPKGALLTGPPGTGKTLLAKAVAGEAGVPFLTMAGSSFMEMYVGVGSSRVRNLFEQARKRAPCIIFIDEIDAVGKSRGSGFGNDERDSTLNQLLVEMDGFKPNETVVVLAATNRADILDPALLRPGRFDRQIEIGLPNKTEREDIFKIYLDKLKIAGNKKSIASHLAEQTVQFSGAEIANVCNEAAILAGREQVKEIRGEHFDRALERVIAGVESSRKLTPDEELAIAYHESGHAVVGYVLGTMGDVVKVSVTPRSNGSLGFTQYFQEDSSLWSQQDLLDQICIFLAGRQSESLFINEVSTGASDDLYRAKKVAKNMIERFGMGETLTGNNVDKQVEVILQTQKERADKILSKHKGSVEKMTAMLQEKKVIQKTEVDEIMKD